MLKRPIGAHCIDYHQTLKIKTTSFSTLLLSKKAAKVWCIIWKCFTAKLTPTKIAFLNGPCTSPEKPKILEACKRVLAAWAMGALPFTYPEEAGLPIGGPSFSRYVMLEVHYNNPELKAGVIDSSGITLTYTPSLREHDAGVMELGLEYTNKMAIPPRQPDFALTAYCVAECTRVGDSLLTTCHYCTSDRENITLGGFAISDEMCVNYVHYYPKMDLEVCKSSIDTKVLKSYFRYMKKYNNEETSGSKEVDENYKSIHWSQANVDFLHHLYSNAPLSMQCNQSSGDRFPGFWYGTPKTEILYPLPLPKRRCPNIMCSSKNDNDEDADDNDVV
ncbi:tyramine beta-hydroxylase [Caerostris extrusa]|uniref:Tyramine beta-hydroxylase n=1 Tax=Caerostris extrusa TaxID=172846 RepID=A0AAV4QN78_CAEEX|nr:tyramine beta-hydroxylase [Caerostris extrusa]